MQNSFIKFRRKHAQVHQLLFKVWCSFDNGWVTLKFKESLQYTKKSIKPINSRTKPKNSQSRYRDRRAEATHKANATKAIKKTNKKAIIQTPRFIRNHIKVGIWDLEDEDEAVQVYVESEIKLSWETSRKIRYDLGRL